LEAFTNIEYANHVGKRNNLRAQFSEQDSFSKFNVNSSQLYIHHISFNGFECEVASQMPQVQAPNDPSFYGLRTGATIFSKLAAPRIS